MTTIGLSLGHDTIPEAEAWLHHLVRGLGLPADLLVACTHLVQDPRPHVALSLDGPVDPDTLPATPPELAGAAEQGRQAHASRVSGRAVYFAGMSALTGTVSVADVLASSRIDRVAVLGGQTPAPETLVDARDFVRPRWTDGLLVLVTAPAAAGRLAPFEVPNPTPCCADHP